MGAGTHAVRKMRLPQLDDRHHGKRLRILRVIARMNVGGPARQVEVLVRDLDPVQFEQRLLVGAIGPGEVDDLVLRGVETPHRRIRGLGRAPSPGDDVRALLALSAEVWRFRPHVVHTHTAKAGALGRLAALLAGFPPRRRPALVHTFHGHLLHGYFSPGATKAVVMAERALARPTDRLVAVGSRVRDELRAVGIGRQGQWEVVPPGIQLRALPSRHEAREALGLPQEAPIVAYVARLTGVKRPDRLVDVAVHVASLVPEALFLVAGDGELAGEVRRRAAAAGIADRLRMLGWTGEVEAVYAAADVVVLTSDNEGMPVSLIEAALAGRPAVTPAVGSAAEVVIDGQTGLVVPPGDAWSLASAVARLLSDGDMRKAMGAAAARLAAKRFSGSRLVADTERIYTEVARQRGYWQ